MQRYNIEVMCHLCREGAVIAQAMQILGYSRHGDDFSSAKQSRCETIWRNVKIHEDVQEN